MQVKAKADDIHDYLTDASNMQGGEAERLYLPESATDIVDILREATDGNIPVTISAGRTGTVGGAIPFGGFVVSLERLNKIKIIDKDTRTVVVEPGVILGNLHKAIDDEGLFYPPDPTEWSCHVGGTVATNASGARSFKYGATREFVKRIEVVLPTGEQIAITRGKFVADKGESLTLTTEAGRAIELNLPTYVRPNVRKNVSGYFSEQPLDAIDLFVGSEGTLGVITEIELALLPKPEGFFSGIVFFKIESDLLSFVDRIRTSSFENRKSGEVYGIDATLIEYFDDRSLKFIAERFPETPEAAGAIFFEQETSVQSEDLLLTSWHDLLDLHNADLERSWFTTNEQDRQKMREFRHALPVAVNERITKYKRRKVGTDMAVPDKNFRAFLSFYKEILDYSGLEYVIFGHIGDCHLHANMLPKSDAEAATARHIYGRCVAQAIMLGGTVSAEHGIGKLKRKYLSAMMGERYLNEMAQIKLALDPKGILGRGNIFDEASL